VQISYAARVNSGMPTADLKYTTFQPSFLYELIFDLALAAALVWLGHHRRIQPQGLFALYVAGYSGYRIFEETIRIDSSAYFLGLRLNFFVAIVATVGGLVWFVIAQRRGGAQHGPPPASASPATASPATAAQSTEAGERAEAAEPGTGQPSTTRRPPPSPAMG
jgi:prolipoprotein diacylglyceryltransferase